MIFFRYVAIQLLAYVLDIGTFLLIVIMGFLDPIAANVIGKVAAGTFAFMAHRNFTFHSYQAENGNRQAVRYFVILALNVPFSSGVLSLFLTWIEELAVAKVFSDGVCVLISYFISKKYIFAKLPLANR